MYVSAPWKGARPLVVALVVLTGLSVTGLALAGQGDPDKVPTVDNPNVSCASPVAGPKVEGTWGRRSRSRRRHPSTS